MEINRSEYKILIVDDVMSNVLLLKVLLTNEKFNIVTATCQMKINTSSRPLSMAKN